MILKNTKIKETKFIEIISVVLLFILIYSFLLSKIPWKLVLNSNLVSGGDTGSHNYVAYYSTKIFPKLKWWSPDWYAGFPFLYFYPPFLYYLVALFQKIIPWMIGLKLVTLLGTLFIPLAIYLSLKILDFRYPIPIIGSVFSLFFIFLEKFSIYGGNLPSTLAGEFSYSLGFALFFIFISLLIKGRENKKLTNYNALLLGLMVIIHPFSVIVATLFGFFVFLYSFLEKKAKETFWYLLKVYGLAFCFSAFWSLPFAMLLPYAAKMNWTKVVKLDEIFPETLVYFEIIAFVTIIWFFVKFFSYNKKIIYFILVLISAFIPFYTLNHSSIWNTRFLPFILMNFLIISAIGIGTFYNEIVKELLEFLKRKKVKFVNVIIPLVFSFLLILGSYLLIFNYLNKKISYIPFWLKWNYEGFEAKSEWPKIKELTAYLKELPYGRIMWEYRGEYDKFGTPRILEDLPLWTQKPTFEGLLIESGISSYFHFINQAETTKTPTSAVAGFEYPPFNFENGVKHLRLFGANYFVSYTKEIKDLADKYLKKIKDVNDFSIYEITDSYLVEVLNEIELKPKTKKWLDESIEWYKGMDFSKPIVFYQNQKELNSINKNIKKTEPLINSVEIISLTNDSLTFKTKDLYKPHLVKISYFPGWRVKGGKGPYLITPSFMMVIPTQEEVKLEYHYNFWDKLGMILSISSITYFVFSFKIIDFLKKKRPFRFESK